MSEGYIQCPFYFNSGVWLEVYLTGRAVIAPGIGQGLTIVVDGLPFTVVWKDFSTMLL